MRALYQRRKGRDLFDLWHALGRGGADAARTVEAFSQYMEHEGHRVSRAEFEENLLGKMANRSFTAEVGPLLASGTSWDVGAAVEVVRTQLLVRLPGEPWKGKPARR
jgi:predicted nucleotidyltransferase component of viral defense system